MAGIGIGLAAGFAAGFLFVRWRAQQYITGYADQLERRVVALERKAGGYDETTASMPGAAG
jgi:hypothetical protein